MRRRDFITLLGGTAVAWPSAALGQQQAMPIVGFLSVGSLRPFTGTVAAFRDGLSETGYVEGKNVALEYRWAEGHNERLPTLAAELVSRQVTALAVLADIAISAAKAATARVPIVFMTGGDPVRNGFVASLNKPGGNVTGATWFSSDPMAKRLALLHQLVPHATVVGQLLDENFQDSVSHINDVQKGARALGLQLIVMKARTAADIDSAFNSLSEQGVHALVTGPGGLTFSRREQIVALAAKYEIPAMFPFREFAEDGGLISYGNKLQDSFRWAGVYVGRVLKGEKPADLPVIESTRFELVINLKTAKVLRLEVPPTLLAVADQVIE